MRASGILMPIFSLPSRYGKMCIRDSIYSVPRDYESELVEETDEEPVEIRRSADDEKIQFLGYRRSDGRVGIRNHVLILPACACGSESSRIVASQVRGAVNIVFNTGCSDVADNTAMSVSYTHLYKKSKRLQKLIEDLFGFTKLNYGKISMKVSKVDIVKLLSQMLEEFYPNFMEKNLAYELQSNVTAKVITADGNLLARLFDNLINNAIKYGSEGKKIIVKVDATDTVVTVSVTNFGYVIPKEELPLLFEKFYRVEQSRSVNTGGTGLGLAIAKNIVDMHGGTIGVTSRCV